MSGLGVRGEAEMSLSRTVRPNGGLARETVVSGLNNFNSVVRMEGPSRSNCLPLPPPYRGENGTGEWK